MAGIEYMVRGRIDLGGQANLELPGLKCDRGTPVPILCGTGTDPEMISRIAAPMVGGII